MIKRWIQRIEIQNFFDNNNQIYILLHIFLESENDLDESYSNLKRIIEKMKIKENRDEFKILLRLISKISNNHHLSSSFESNIKQLLNDFKDDITKTFSNFEIFNIFKDNKRILLFLFGNETIIPDSEVSTLINKSVNFNQIDNKSYSLFFYPEIQSFIDNQFCAFIENYLVDNHYKIDENYEEKRQTGENDSLLCKMLREDLIDEFTSYSTRTNLDLNSKINHSIFETHQFLLKNRPSLIEYAAFFGSIQIIKYLFLHDVQIEPTIWLYSIHSKNSELIHLLEDNHVELDKELSIQCLQESIKCHHIEIAQYFHENHANKVASGNELASFGFKYYNFLCFPNDFYNHFTIYYACKYDYLSLVKIILNTQKIDLLNKFDDFDLFKVSSDKNNYEIVNCLLSKIGSYIPSGMFRRCNKLERINIPSNIIRIGDYAFRDCTSLTQITISSSVISIGDYAFDRCTSLTQITIPSSVISIGKSIFNGCKELDKIIIVPNHEKRIEFIEETFLIFKTKLTNQFFDKILWAKQSIQTVKIPTFIETIGDYAFSYCSSLTQITIPSSVTSIGDCAFSGCSSLTQITIPSSVTSIGNCAFSRCSSLTQITIPSSVTSIESFAFFECSSLKKVTFDNPSSITSIESSTFSGCSSLTEITIPSSVISIKDNAFANCSSLKEVIVLNPTTEIGRQAFGYFSLNQVIIQPT